MDDTDNFEWDSRKAVANLKKHDVTFDQAIEAFHDPYAFEEVDERKDYGEERINLIGMCNGMIIHVTYTERGERIRLISARKAEKDERDDYYRQKAT
jgi:uncharacterized DUF497 family protein